MNALTENFRWDNYTENDHSSQYIEFLFSLDQYTSKLPKSEVQPAKRITFRCTISTYGGGTTGS